MNNIVLKNVSKSFDSKRVLDDVTFTFESGRFYVLRGKSGCGKTTLLNILIGYQLPDSGEIITGSSIDYLFQDELLFTNLTVKENMLIKHFAKNKSSAPNEEFLNSILAKLNIPGLINKKVYCLSGGERQRIEMANILILNPDFILLDEPTAKLDPENKERLLNLITTVFADKTLLVVSHESELFPQQFIHLRLEEGKLQYE